MNEGVDPAKLGDNETGYVELDDRCTVGGRTGRCDGHPRLLLWLNPP